MLLYAIGLDGKISPCFGEGSGLKLGYAVAEGAIIQISPCFGEGSGLKLRFPYADRQRMNLPLLR